MASCSFTLNPKRSGQQLLVAPDVCVFQLQEDSPVYTLIQGNTEAFDQISDQHQRNMGIRLMS